MKVLILSGGLGTRLRAIVRDRPKPMSEVKSRPFLEYQIERLGAQGFKEIVLCVGYLMDLIQDYFGRGHRWGVQIVYSVENELLGTAGAIRNARHFIEDTFLVLNGDSYLEIDFERIVEFHHARRTANPLIVGTIATVVVDDVTAYGTLELDNTGRILSFREKAEVAPGWINGGVYVLEPDIIDFIPTGQAISIERETFPMVLKRGRHLLGYSVEGFFVDIGTPEGYQRFQNYVEDES